MLAHTKASPAAGVVFTNSYTTHTINPHRLTSNKYTVTHFGHRSNGNSHMQYKNSSTHGTLMSLCENNEREKKRNSGRNSVTEEIKEKVREMQTLQTPYYLNLMYCKVLYSFSIDTGTCVAISSNCGAQVDRHGPG